MLFSELNRVLHAFGNVLRQRSLLPQLFGFERLIDGFLSSFGAVLPASAALHHTRVFHLLVPRPRQNVVRFPLFIRHNPRDLQREALHEEEVKADINWRRQKTKKKHENVTEGDE